MKCPKCDCRVLLITVERQAEVKFSRDGQDHDVIDEDGDTLWGDTSQVICKKCGWEGAAMDFEIPEPAPLNKEEQLRQALRRLHEYCRDADAAYRNGFPLTVGLYAEVTRALKAK